MAERRLLSAPVWPARDDRARVLVEARDEARRTATERTLGAGGYEVLSCTGPVAGHDEDCPAVGGGRCHAAAHADVVVCDLDLTDPYCRDIPAAVVREMRAGAAVVVLTDGGGAELHLDELEGCRLLDAPVDDDRLLQEVAAALEHLAEAPRPTPLRPRRGPPRRRH